jgi:hypothetical protein
VAGFGILKTTPCILTSWFANVIPLTGEVPLRQMVEQELKNQIMFSGGYFIYGCSFWR